jgi:hypothetical protein
MIRTKIHMENCSNVLELDCKEGLISYNGKLYAPLEDFCNKYGINYNALIDDTVLDSLNKIKKRTGKFPVTKHKI